MDAKTKEKLEYTMKTLGMTEEEVLEMWAEDKEIDRGAKLYELDPELEAGAKKARQADRKKNTTTTREKKIDNDKIALVEMLKNAVAPSVSNLAPVMKDGKPKDAEFEFFYNNRKFKVVLSAPRS